MPLFQESPGLIDGYWTFEHSNGKSFGFTLFDTAEHAHELKRAIENFVEEKEEPKVQLEMIVEGHEKCSANDTKSAEYRAGG